MTSVLVLNGPNLNLLGTRKPEVYGRTTLADVEAMCREEGGKLGLDVEFRQSNHEGALIDWIHEFGAEVNECHISNVHKREEFRHHSFISPVAAGIVVGFGVQGYVMGLRALHDMSNAAA
jgi:3-dehydroquinate dehydratase-2